MDAEKQRQRRHNDGRLTESGNARSEQLFIMPTELLTIREWLPGELLSGSEHRRPGFRDEISDLLIIQLWKKMSVLKFLLLYLDKLSR